MNPRYPLEIPQSVDALMGIALGMEREAALRYRQLGERMERHGEGVLAATFRDLAALEESHERGLADWARREGRPVPEARQFQWQLPETFAEADLAGAPLSPYQALAVAVRNEEQAFSFYSYLSAMTEVQPALRVYAEALAREELAHIGQLRRLRRRAFHSEGLAERLAPPKITDLASFHRLAWGLESGTAALCRLLRERLAEGDGAMAATLLDRTCGEAERRASAMAEKGGGGSVPPGSRTIEEARGRRLFSGVEVPVEQLLELCEKDTQEVLDSYLSIAEAAGDELLLMAAQDSAEHALARLAILRSLRDRFAD